MKDYSLYEEDRILFIRSFKKINDKLRIKYAAGRKHNVPVKIKKDLLDKMENQVKNTTEDRFKSNKEGLPFGSFILISMLIAALAIGFSFIAMPILISGILGTVSIITFFSGLIKHDIINNYILKKDYEKNKFFLDNRQELEQDLSHPNIIKNLNRKTARVILNEPERDKKLNINNIDKLKLKDIRDILIALKRNENLGLDKSNYTLGRRVR